MFNSHSGGAFSNFCRTALTRFPEHSLRQATSCTTSGTATDAWSTSVATCTRGSSTRTVSMAWARSTTRTGTASWASSLTTAGRGWAPCTGSRGLRSMRASGRRTGARL
eukprot:3793080-Pyramimonas_sp.AAC.1